MPRRRKVKNPPIHREGERGYTVCLMRKPGRDSLWLRWWDGSRRAGKGNYVWRSLGHDDEEAGKDECKDLAAMLFVGAKPTDPEAGPTILETFAHYEQHKTKRKKQKQQGYDRHRMDLWQQFLTVGRQALTIDPDTVEGYIQWRRSQGISDTTIGHEIVFLRGVLDWATTKRMNDGRPLLLFNPIARVKRIRAKNPHTPVARHEVYLALRRYADRVDPQKLLRPMLVLVREHGWRLKPWCRLWASDFRFEPVVASDGTIWPWGAIRKRSATDKMGRESWRPMTPRSHRAARLLVRRSGAIGDTYLFRAPIADGPWQQQHALDLLHRTESLATEDLRRGEVIGAEEVVELGGFHALRRLWATERKGEPLVDVADAGDWHPATLLNYYQKSDPETTLRVTMNRRKRAGN